MDYRFFATLAAALLLLPCAAIAALTSAERKSQFEKAMGVILAREMTNYSDATRADVIRGYVNAKPNKAQAIQLEVGAPWRSIPVYNQ